MQNTTLTKPAFDRYRGNWSLQNMHPECARYSGDTEVLTTADGLNHWHDGVPAVTGTASVVPDIGKSPKNKQLWVVVSDDVLTAAEDCDFGACRGAGAVKHSNLTGGGSAYCGGELIFLDTCTIVINGCSGRYRLRNEKEYDDVIKAFKNSGYNVWSMGYDSDTNQPNRFGVKIPEWVE